MQYLQVSNNSEDTWNEQPDQCEQLEQGRVDQRDEGGQCNNAST